MTPIETHKRSLEEFDKKFPNKIAEVVDDFGSSIKSDIKSEIIQSHIDLINALEEQIENEVDWHNGSACSDVREIIALTLSALKSSMKE